MIPKVIHYCWFGGNPLTELAEKCIESWRKHFPDYQIVEWNENNFDINCCTYVRQAYEAKKWAFVSDYARFKILYESGGIYFDTDVEVIKPFDHILEKGGFMGCENAQGSVNPGLGIALPPGLDIIKEILDDYEASEFLKPDGSCDLTTIVERTTNLLKRYGLVETSQIQQIADIYIYPMEYFCPIDIETGKMHITNNTYSIHRYDGSWITPVNRRNTIIYQHLTRYLGKNTAKRIKKIKIKICTLFK